MHIVHLYKDAYPPVMGGVERMIWWLAKRQAAAGDRVTVLAAQPMDQSHGTLPESETVEGVEIVRMKSLARPGGTPVCLGMTGRLRSLEPDLIHLHHPNPSSDLAAIMARLPAPLVVTYHSDVVRQKFQYRAYQPVQQSMLRKAAAIMPTSHRYMETSEQLRSHLDRCHVVPLGVEPILKNPEESLFGQRVAIRRKNWGRRPVVLFVGVLRYYKGLQFLVEAATHLPEASIVLVGDGPERPFLERLSEELGVSDRVYFTGFVEDKDIPEIHDASDIFCMPSHLRAEAFGLSMVEAMHAAKPCVACDLPSGVPEVNEHMQTGLIVPPEDPVALAEALRKLIEDEELRGRLGHQACQKARREYTADRMFERVAEVYDHVLKQ